PYRTSVTQLVRSLVPHSHSLPCKTYTPPASPGKLPLLRFASDTSHPAHSLFSLLPSGRRYWSLRCRTTRLRNGFIHQAVRKLNSLPSLPPVIFARSGAHTS